jgi:ankyrin repeat protein
LYGFSVKTALASLNLAVALIDTTPINMLRFLLVILSICTLFYFPAANAQSSKELFAAVKKNNISELRSLLNKGADPNSYDDDSDHVLMYVVLYSSIDIMQLLLEKGSNPNAKNKTGETPLMWSVHDITKTKLLLDNGADINAKAASGNTALLIASVGYGKYEMIKFLIDRGADPLAINNRKENVLMRAALFGDTATISLLLSKGIDINAMRSDSSTALINAIFNVNRLVTIQLLERGADANLVSSFGLTAISAAVTYNDVESIKAILKKTKNINALDYDGHTSLMWAAYNEHDNPEIILALLDRGADVNVKAKDGSTALSWALKKGNTATVALLKKAGAQ